MPEFGMTEIAVAIFCGVMLFGPISLLPWVIARVIKAVQAELRKITDVQDNSRH